MSITRMPAVFIGHGSPMNTLEQNRWTEAWRELGAQLPRPRAVLVVSAHWFINATAVTAMPAPRTIHDFFGFGPDLFSFTYPTPGDPELAADIAASLDPIWCGLDIDSWGIDHGAWSVLAHLLPDADVPVIQLSIDAQKSLSQHLELGAALAPWRDQGVLVVCSGNVVHNLSILQWDSPDAGTPWAEAFDAAARDLVVGDPAALGNLEQHPAWKLAVPTMDHFLPIAYFAGLASAADHAASVLVEGCAMGTLSMTSYLLPGDER